MKRRRRGRITEQENPISSSLDTLPTREILRIINLEDHRVAPAVKMVIPQIARAVDLAVKAIRRGGRLIYLGAGTGGRLGVLDATECLTTFGSDRVVAVMAGAPRSLWKPMEEMEDDPRQAVRDLRAIKLDGRDLLVGISAGGQTPYVLKGLRYAQRRGARTVALTSNPAAPLKRLADVVIHPTVGPEIIAGSTRMKAGTAQKLVLNMLSTTTMVRLGRVFSNWMIQVQMHNEKLKKRGHAILREATGVSAASAAKALELAGGSLPVALLMLLKKVSKQDARALLENGGDVAQILRNARVEGWRGAARA